MEIFGNLHFGYIGIICPAWVFVIAWESPCVFSFAIFIVVIECKGIAFEHGVGFVVRYCRCLACGDYR